MDSRGFRYALAPALNRADWRLDDARRALAGAVAALEEHRERHAGLEAEYAAAATGLATQRGAVVDLARRAHALRYLGQVRQRIDQSLTQLRDHEQARNEAQQALAAAHRAVELLRQHKDDSRRRYAEEQLRRATIMQDEDAMVRRAWRRASGMVEPGRGEA